MTKGNEDPRSEERILEDFKRLKDWIAKQPHLPRDFDESFLMAFVRGTKTVEIAKQKLDYFCKIRSQYQQYFAFPFRDPLESDLKQSFEATQMFMLPKPSPDGYKVFMFINKDYSKYVPKAYNARLTMILETVITTIPDLPGVVLVMDAQGVDSSILTRISISEMIFLIQYVQSSLPLKLKKIIVINAPTVFERFMTIFVKPYMKKKILDRVFFTTKGREVLADHLPVDILPKDVMGGSAQSTSQLNDDWIKILQDKRDWFLKTANLCTDESKRLPDGANTYGVEGTFRKLAVD